MNQDKPCIDLVFDSSEISDVHFVYLPIDSWNTDARNVVLSYILATRWQTCTYQCSHDETAKPYKHIKDQWKILVPPRLNKNNVLPPIFTATFTLPPPNLGASHYRKMKRVFIYTTWLTLHTFCHVCKTMQGMVIHYVTLILTRFLFVQLTVKY